jgi:hypothetical protein
LSASRAWTQRIGRAGIIAELGRIHVDEVHDEALGAASGTNCAIWPERRRRSDLAGGVPLTKRAGGAVEQVSESAWRASALGGGGERFWCGALRHALAEARPIAPERRQVGGIGLVVREAGEMDAAERAEMLQDVPRADLVAAIGRVRDAVGEEEDVAHQPSPRAIGGPSRFASGSGSFFQSATWSRYLGLKGLVSRASPFTA